MTDNRNDKKWTYDLSDEVRLVSRLCGKERKPLDVDQMEGCVGDRRR